MRGAGGSRFGVAGPANTGQGGGSGYGNGPFGGSGVVIIKYRKGDAQ
jgi:hypothetical protein